jgi:hypothetical protein
MRKTMCTTPTWVGDRDAPDTQSHASAMDRSGGGGNAGNGCTRRDRHRSRSRTRATPRVQGTRAIIGAGGRGSCRKRRLRRSASTDCRPPPLSRACLADTQAHAHVELRCTKTESVTRQQRRRRRRRLRWLRPWMWPRRTDGRTGGHCCDFWRNSRSRDGKKPGE